MFLNALKSTLAYLLYVVTVTLLLPLMPLRLWWKGRNAPAYRQRMGERFSLRSPAVRAGGVWVHAVSVGEVVAITPTINDLLDVHTERDILVTTTTPTGSQRLLSSFSYRDDDKPRDASDTGKRRGIKHQYMPYDWPILIWLFLRATRPALFVVVETELWPITLLLCRWLSIPVLVANARLSAKSANGYKRVGWLTRAMLKQVWIAAQGESDRMNFIDIGVSANKVRVIGNIKYDAEIDNALKARAAQLRSALQRAGKNFVWVAGSTHRGEDEVILEAHRWLVEHSPNAMLILVPRHPERFDEVAKLIEKTGFNYSRRSRDDAITARKQVLLLDKMGELMASYGASDFAFVGGSLVPVGGHNYLEPAMWSLPMATGPHQHNFELIAAELKSVGALVQVESVDELANLLISMENDAKKRESLGVNALQVVERNRGARQRLLEMIGIRLTQQ